MMKSAVVLVYSSSYAAVVSLPSELLYLITLKSRLRLRLTQHLIAQGVCTATSRLVPLALVEALVAILPLQ